MLGEARSLVLGRWSGLGGRCPRAGWHRGEQGMGSDREEAEASGEGQGGPTPGSRTWPASSPRLCPQILLREPGWRQLEQHRAERRSQALLTLHSGLRAYISRQRLRLLPRIQARVRGLQARSAGAG